VVVVKFIKDLQHRPSPREKDKRMRLKTSSGLSEGEEQRTILAYRGATDLDLFEK
jgi:hypothetical protein